jgi:hypothetical protein
MANHFIDNFLGNLNASENRAIERYLKNNLTNGEESKSLEVFRLLSTNNTVKYSNQAAFNKIKSRIFEKSLDALITDEQYLKETFCETDYRILKQKKTLLIIRALQRSQTKNKTETIKHLLDNVIKESMKYETFSILIEALIAKKFFVVARNGMTEFETINKKIKFYHQCEAALFKACDMHAKLVSNQNVHSYLTKKETFNHIVSSIKYMEKHFSITKSQQIHYYLLIMKFAFHEQKKEYKKCITYCHKLITLLKKSPAVYRTERMGFAYDNLATFYFFCSNFKQAEIFLNKALKCFLPESFNTMICLEVKFFSLFYQKKYIASSRSLNVILNHPLYDTGKFRNAKFIYYKAYSLFIEGHYKNCLALISKPLEIEKDKSKWKIGLGILNILLAIEMQQTDKASRSLDALRKYLERNLHDKKISPRDRLIVKTLRELEKNDFEFNPKNTVLNNYVKKLSAKNTSASWEFFSPELIPFHEWIGKRIK